MVREIPLFQDLKFLILTVVDAHWMRPVFNGPEEMNEGLRSTQTCRA